MEFEPSEMILMLENPGYGREPQDRCSRYGWLMS